MEPGIGVYDQQNCTHCGSHMSVNSIRYQEMLNNKIHYYRESTCMQCRKKFKINIKEKKYCFWGWICYNTIDRPDIPL